MSLMTDPQTPITPVDLQNAAVRLAQSTKGRNALRALLKWLDADGLTLDADNQDAVYTLLAGAWGSYAGTARDLMRDSLAVRKPR